MSSKELANCEVREDLNDEFSIPLDISDIINICKEYNKLGWQIQKQMENIVELGVEESIKSGYVKPDSLMLIKNFLHEVTKNPYFGDAGSQAKHCLYLINLYQEQKRKADLN